MIFLLYFPDHIRDNIDGLYVLSQHSQDRSYLVVRDYGLVC
jgi:hypothetical protein